ncbi:MAG TPA: hypothetical protein VJP86_13515 [Vicinamibacterales bacterium]|nr:hypothetical protein [Vicinamibacterales bacterium]
MKTLLRLSTSIMLAASGAIISAQQLLPSSPPKGFGASVTPAYEGWFDNADGTHSFLIGYYNRNTKQELDIPIGPDNHFEPGIPDMGQPTHFLTGRNYGVFVYTVPKEFGKTQKLTWVLNSNGVRNSVPFYMSPDYNVAPFKSSEESPGGGWNVPPTLRFVDKGPSFAGPIANPARALARTATAGVPLPLEFFAEDDALTSSGSNAPSRNPGVPVTLSLAKYRGPGAVTFEAARPKLETLTGGKLGEPFTGKTSTTVTFAEPGDYMLHVTANDYSGNGGGGTVCCWTTAIVKVAVSGATAPVRTGGFQD